MIEPKALTQGIEQCWLFGLPIWQLDLQSSMQRLGQFFRSQYWRGFPGGLLDSSANPE